VVIDATLAHRIFDWGGWNALVAVGTLALAMATYGVIRATKALAERGDAEIAAQWRPLLLVRDRLADVTGPEIVYEEGSLTLWIENVGRGPALEVQSWLDDFPAPGPAYGVPAGLPPGRGGGMGSRLHTVVAQGDLLPYRWTDLGEPRKSLRGQFQYTDLSGGGHSTSFAIEVNESRPTLGLQVVDDRSWRPVSS
jgi:hypothetical protein